jgi:hypothetical protein
MFVSGYYQRRLIGQLISELSRELSTNEIALFSIVLSAEFGQKNLHSTENKSEKNINIKIFLQNLKCCSTTTKDLGPVVQKPINANLGLNLLNLGLNFNPRLLCVVQS